MKLQDVNLVMALIDANPFIKKHKFFRFNGRPCEFSPSAGVLFKDHTTGAIAVIQDKPIFVGDRLWYKSRNYEGFVNVIGYNGLQPDDFNYYFSIDGISLRDIVISKSLLAEFLSLERPKPEYSKMSFNGKPIKAISTIYTSAYPIKITDSKGIEYWADSNDTANALGTNLQLVCDEIVAAIAAQKTVRIMIDGKPSTLITH